MSLILVCTATATETRACRRGLRGASGFEVLPTGMGPERAERALANRLKRGPRPDEIHSTGFAGSRVPRIEVGTWILATRLRGPGLAELALDSSSWKARLERAGIAHECVSLQSVERVAGAGAKLDSDTVDMESSALARVARKHGIPFHVLRLVSDSPALPIPESVVDLVSGSKARGLLSLALAPRNTAHFVLRMRGLNVKLALAWEKLRRDPTPIKRP
jgi:hypothetical protein